MMPQKTMADNDLYIDFFCGMLDKKYPAYLFKQMAIFVKPEQKSLVGAADAKVNSTPTSFIDIENAHEFACKKSIGLRM